MHNPSTHRTLGGPSRGVVSPGRCASGARSNCTKGVLARSRPVPECRTSSCLTFRITIVKPSQGKEWSDALHLASVPGKAKVLIDIDGSSVTHVHFIYIIFVLIHLSLGLSLTTCSPSPISLGAVQ